MHARGESFRKWPTAGHIVSELQELHMHKAVFENVIECEVSEQRFEVSVPIIL